MKTKNNEIYKNSTTLELELRNKEIEQMIEWLPEWKDNKEIRNLLLRQINKAKFEVKMLNAKLKVIDFIDSFKEQPKKAN